VPEIYEIEVELVVEKPVDYMGYNHNQVGDNYNHYNNFVDNFVDNLVDNLVGSLVDSWVGNLVDSWVGNLAANMVDNQPEDKDKDQWVVVEDNQA
jgi:hypothetical protein